MQVALAIPLTCSVCSAEVLIRLKEHKVVFWGVFWVEKLKAMLPISHSLQTPRDTVREVLGIYLRHETVCPGSFCRNLLKCLKLKCTPTSK